MTGFAALDPKIPAYAILDVQPGIAALMERGTVKRDQGHLVILDPTIPYEPKYTSPDDENFLDLVLCEHSWGDPKNWDGPFRDVARSKAFISFKTGFPSDEVQTTHPYLYQPGWTKWGGSTYRNGLVVAFSGVEAYYDQMFSEWVASAIVAECKRVMTQAMADSSITFLGQTT